MKCDDIPYLLDLCLFDFGVNAGLGRTVKFFTTNDWHNS